MMGAMRTSHNLSRTHAIAVTLASAALFGFATPAVKPFIAGVEPQLAAGVLYLGMGLGLAGRYAARGFPRPGIERSELGWLALSLVCGGVAAPWLIFWGLAHGTATATSLLTNMEIVFSTLLARFWFGERYPGRLFLGVGAIVGGAVVLSGLHGGIDPIPAAAIVGACAFWGVDNNSMRKIAHADAGFVGCAKGLLSGAVNTGIAMSWGAAWPETPAILGIAAIGMVCYGASFSLYVRGLRVLGAARTSALYGVAPFAGALVGVGFLHESISLHLVLAAVLISVGVWIHLVEPHAPMGPHLVDVPDDPDNRR